MRHLVGCYIEQQNDGKWYICFPDGSRADYQGFKTKGWATRVLGGWIK